MDKQTGGSLPKLSVYFSPVTGNCFSSESAAKGERANDLHENIYRTRGVCVCGGGGGSISVMLAYEANTLQTEIPCLVRNWVYTSDIE